MENIKEPNHHSSAATTSSGTQTFTQSISSPASSTFRHNNQEVTRDRMPDSFPFRVRDEKNNSQPIVVTQVQSHLPLNTMLGYHEPRLSGYRSNVMLPPPPSLPSQSPQTTTAPSASAVPLPFPVSMDSNVLHLRTDATRRVNFPQNPLFVTPNYETTYGAVPAPVSLYPRLQIPNDNAGMTFGFPRPVQMMQPAPLMYNDYALPNPLDNKPYLAPTPMPDLSHELQPTAGGSTIVSSPILSLPSNPCSIVTHPSLHHAVS